MDKGIEYILEVAPLRRDHKSRGQSVYHALGPEQICPGPGGTAAGEAVPPHRQTLRADPGRGILRPEKPGNRADSAGAGNADEPLLQHEPRRDPAGRSGQLYGGHVPFHIAGAEGGISGHQYPHARTSHRGTDPDGKGTASWMCCWR